ncbi:MAG: DUF1156 domain-containing protein [Desulfatibacillaceae bacterium]|nr:DUF1156 domain-containing protein [Desulfatibacillaceae bacterium]
MTDRRLIEDYLPIQAISKAASSEPRTKGHLSTMHIWRARRPLVACRAAVYGALVPLDQFVPNNAPSENQAGLARANAANKVKTLCTYNTSIGFVRDAQQDILGAHAVRLTEELLHAQPGGQAPAHVGQGEFEGGKVRVSDIMEGRAPRPRLLDMFAGGGAIPLEAARLGCESHAVDINPVAFLIMLCTTTFPQKYGPKLADDVEKWGRQVLDKTRDSVAEVLTSIPYTPTDKRHQEAQKKGLLPKELSIVAHYWTRTIPCPNPSCRGTVPLFRQTWLRKKPSGYVALKPIPDHGQKVVRFQVRESSLETGFDFDPGEGSRGSATICPFCTSTLDGKYVREHGKREGFGQQLMCVITLNPEGSGKWFLTDESLAEGEEEKQSRAEKLAAKIEKELGPSSLDETILPTGNAGLATGKSYLYGVETFRHAFTPRQRYILLTMAREIRSAHQEMLDQCMDKDRADAITTYLGIWLSRLTDRFSSLARWDNSGEKIQGITSMKRFSMSWDFPEVNIFGGASGDAMGNLGFITAVIRQEGIYKNPVHCQRGSATSLPFEDGFFDAVVTDPPYYDNESYAELSDVCYVWLRPAVGFLYPEHFATSLTPKKKECVAAAYRQGGTKEAAHRFYEDSMAQALREAWRVTKKDGILVLVYAHKTTVGWSTLVEALKNAGYEVVEAWPIETETKARVAHQGDAALASSIFLVARKREGQTIGSYENEVQPELKQIVRERVKALWKQGISGANLLIACVGAGLRAFTKYAKVEYANGEPVPAERFLAEIETVVLDNILRRLSKEVGSNGHTISLDGLDPATRFYVLWRYTYRFAPLDAGEAIIFANGTHVELDGQNGLSAGTNALLEKIKGKYRMRDFTERGKNSKLGLPADGAEPPVIDSLHRVLWLMENKPTALAGFLGEANPKKETMRLVAQVLAGPVLKGGEMEGYSPPEELAALAKLTANWKSVVEDATFTKTEKKDRDSGQRRLFE